MQFTENLCVSALTASLIKWPASQPASCGAGFLKLSWRPLLELTDLFSLVRICTRGTSPPSLHPSAFFPSMSSSSSNSSCIRDTGSRGMSGAWAGDDIVGSWREKGFKAPGGGFKKRTFYGLMLSLFPAGAHQDKRGELSGQTDSIRRVDPQQVVGRHVQVVVAMGWGKNAHLPAKSRKVLNNSGQFLDGPMKDFLASLTCLRSSTAPAFNSSDLSSKRRRCTVPWISPLARNHER